MKAIITIWSELGYCPITGRTGQYCDELACATIEVDGLADASVALGIMLRNVPRADYGHMMVPDHWNQNERSQWRTADSARQSAGCNVQDRASVGIRQAALGK